MLEYINKILWAVAIAMIFLNSIYFSFKLKFPQLKIKTIFKTILNKESHDGLSPKDTLLMTLGSKIGAGSIAGVSFAIFYGGIGAVFWMWVSSLFVSINCFLENFLAIIYKEKDGNYYKGGPAYYLKKGLGKKNLSIIYSILAICAYIFGFLAIQNNTITTLVTEIYTIDKIIIALIVTIISAFAIVKGLKLISKVCNTIVPIMTIMYIVLGIIVIVINLDIVPSVLANIVKSAFTPSAVTGGFVYTFLIGMQKATFSNEAGVGTSAMLAGASSNKDPVKQGFFGIIETYFITIFVTTITALIVILSSYKTLNLNNINGIEITKFALFDHFGHFGEIMLLIILLLFSFSTIVSGYYLGESNLKNLTSSKRLISILKIITLCSVFIGGILSALFVWKVVDLFIALLAIINIYAIFNLKDVIFKRLKC